MNFQNIPTNILNNITKQSINNTIEDKINSITFDLELQSKKSIKYTKNGWNIKISHHTLPRLNTKNLHMDIEGQNELYNFYSSCSVGTTTLGGNIIAIKLPMLLTNKDYSYVSNNDIPNYKNLVQIVLSIYIRNLKFYQENYNNYKIMLYYDIHDNVEKFMTKPFPIENIIEKIFF